MTEKLTALADLLNTRGYRATVFQTAAEATAYLTESLAGLTVGIGGSMTALEMGLDTALAPVCRLHWHWRPAEGCTAADELAAAAEAEAYGLIDKVIERR